MRTITRSKGGTKERKVPIDRVQIPDLWHVGRHMIQEGGLAHKEQGEAILECWHLCHDLLRELREESK